MPKAFDDRVVTAFAAALIAATGASGCASDPQTAEVSYIAQGEDEFQSPTSGERRTPTERELEVMRDLGVSDEAIDRMAAEGMDPVEAERAERAVQLLEHLEEKYNCMFKAAELASPELLDRRWQLAATALSGDGEGVTAVCQWHWHEVDEPYFTDDYVTKARSDEVEAYLMDVIREVYAQTQADALADVTPGEGQLPDAVTLTSPLKDVTGQVMSDVRIYFSPQSPLTEEQYLELADTLVDALNEREAWVSYELVHVLKPADGYEHGDAFTLDMAACAVGEGANGENYEWKITGGTNGHREGSW